MTATENNSAPSSLGSAGARRGRGRQIGETVNPRDERGWMIPREGTVRRRIYDMILQGKQGQQIWKVIGISHAAYTNHRRHIMRSEHMNREQYRYINGAAE